MQDTEVACGECEYGSSVDSKSRDEASFSVDLR